MWRIKVKIIKGKIILFLPKHKQERRLVDGVVKKIYGDAKNVYLEME